MTDLQFLQAYRAGELKDLGEIVARHLSLIYGTAKRLAGDRDAADITLAVLAYLAQTQARSNRRASLANWCFETTYQCCKLHKNATRGGISAAEMAMDQSQLRFPDDILMMLRPPEREVLLLHCLENQTLEDAADALGIPVDRASACVKRGFAQMQVLLESHGRASDQMMMTRILTAISQEKSAPPMPPVIPQALSPTARDLVVALAARKPIGRIIAASAFIVIIGAMLIVAVIMSAAFLSPTKNDKPVPPPTAANQPVEMPAIESAAQYKQIDTRAWIESPHTLDPLPDGRLCVGSYVVLLSDKLATKFSELGAPEPTESQGFTVYRFAASTLHQTFREMSDEMIVASRDVALARPNDAPAMRVPPILMVPGLYIDRDDARKPKLMVEHLNGIFGVPGPSKTLSLNPDGRIIVNMDERLISGQLVCRDHRPPAIKLTGQIQLQSPMAQDEALICIGESLQTSSTDPSRKVSLAIVIESFSLTPKEAYILTSRPKCPRWDWPIYGASYARWMTGQAMIWDSMARARLLNRQPGLPGAEQKLSDGQTFVRLVAFSRPDVGHSCWWGFDGQPLAGVPPLFNLTSSRTPKLRVLVEARRTPTGESWAIDELKKYPISGNSGLETELSRFDAVGMWRQLSVLVDPDAPQLRLLVSVDAGKFAGTIDPAIPGPQAAGHCSIKFQQQTNGDVVYLSGEVRALSQFEDPYFVLKFKDGRVLPLLYEPHMMTDKDHHVAPLVLVGGRVSQTLWQQTERIELWIRPLVRVTFDHLPAAPVVALPMEFSTNDVAAAEQKFKYAVTTPPR